MEDYLVPRSVGQAEYIEKKSRFLGGVYPVTSEQEAKEILERVRRQHYDARHNCWCYMIRDGAVRYSDDGEPQGTAGLPMLEAIKGKGLCNTTVVVTRYFGGIKLGAGGLVRAYGGAASDVLALAGKEEHIPSVLFSLTLPYDRYSAFLSKKESFRHKILSSDFGETILVTLAVPEEDSSRFFADMNDLFAGKVPISRLNEDFAVY